VRRVELTHDVLCGVVKASRDLRLESEARAAPNACSPSSVSASWPAPALVRAARSPRLRMLLAPVPSWRPALPM